MLASCSNWRGGGRKPNACAVSAANVEPDHPRLPTADAQRYGSRAPSANPRAGPGPGGSANRLDVDSPRCGNVCAVVRSSDVPSQTGGYCYAAHGIDATPRHGDHSAANAARAAAASTHRHPVDPAQLACWHTRRPASSKHTDGCPADSESVSSSIRACYRCPAARSCSPDRRCVGTERLSDSLATHLRTPNQPIAPAARPRPTWVYHGFPLWRAIGRA